MKSGFADPERARSGENEIRGALLVHAARGYEGDLRERPRVNSLLWGVLFGLGVGGFLAFLIASIPQEALWERHY